MSETHAIAERYLRDLERGNAHFYKHENAEIIPVAQQKVNQRVVLMRDSQPHYLAGFMSSGRPAWTHDMKLAVSHEVESEKLADHLTRLKVMDIEVMTMPACWFSNHI